MAIKLFEGKFGQSQLMRERNRSGDAPAGGWGFFPWREQSLGVLPVKVRYLALWPGWIAG
jgi:hypothetical protein